MESWELCVLKFVLWSVQCFLLEQMLICYDCPWTIAAAESIEAKMGLAPSKQLVTSILRDTASILDEQNGSLKVLCEANSAKEEW